MKIFDQGNFSRLARFLISLIGVALILYAIYGTDDREIKWVVGMLGLVIGSVGRYANEAAIFKLKPFEKSSISSRESKDSQKNNSDETTDLPGRD